MTSCAAASLGKDRITAGRKTLCSRSHASLPDCCVCCCYASSCGRSGDDSSAAAFTNTGSSPTQVAGRSSATAAMAARSTVDTARMVSQNSRFARINSTAKPSPYYGASPDNFPAFSCGTSAVARSHSNMAFVILAGPSGRSATASFIAAILATDSLCSYYSF